nr:uncharacterized protein LOC123290195 [Equus asinus]
MPKSPSRPPNLTQVGSKGRRGGQYCWERFSVPVSLLQPEPSATQALGGASALTRGDAQGCRGRLRARLCTSSLSSSESVFLLKLANSLAQYPSPPRAVTTGEKGQGVCVPRPPLRGAPGPGERAGVADEAARPHLDGGKLKNSGWSGRVRESE